MSGLAAPEQRTDVLVVGAGPAGLACAHELAGQGLSTVVVDRAPALGGVPAYTGHLGYGRHLGRVMTGPAYARTLVQRAADAGADLRAETSVTGWVEPATLRRPPAVDVTSPAGPARVVARAVVLATGCREQPRHARGVPGDRPAGVLTTGRLQQAVEWYPAGRAQVGRRAVVVGAEHVSVSAVATLAAAGCKTLALLTDLPRHQTLPLVPAALTVLRDVPVRAGVAVTAIHGRQRVEAVEVTDLTDGRRGRLACDTVVFTGGWTVDNELARLGGLGLTAGSGGPSVDQALRTTRPGVFAAGNALHPAESADASARAGRLCGQTVGDFLAFGGAWRSPNEVSMVTNAPLRWITPDVLSWPASHPVVRHAVLRSDAFARGRLLVTQDGRRLWRGRFQRLVPNRSIRLPLGFTHLVDPGGGPVVVAVG